MRIMAPGLVSLVSEYYGGQVAAPIAHDIFLQLFRYANVKPINGNQSLLDDIKGTEAKNQ